MTESKTHRFIKEKIAEAFRELGYNTETEKRVKEGRLDVYAEKNGNEVKVEVYKSHIADWIVMKVHGDIPELESLYEKINKKNKPNAIFLKNFLLALVAKDNSLTCMICPRDGKLPPKNMFEEKDLISHYIKEHVPMKWEKYPDLIIPNSN